MLKGHCLTLKQQGCVRQSLTRPNGSPCKYYSKLRKVPVMSYDVVLFYKYTRLAKPDDVIVFLQALCGPDGLGLTGRVLIAPEGVNGTLAGLRRVDDEGALLPTFVYAGFVSYLPALAGRDCIQRFITSFSACDLADFTSIDFKRSMADVPPFPTLLLKNVPVCLR